MPTIVSANPDVGELKHQIPGLLDMIKERQQQLKKELNKDGMSYTTFDQGETKKKKGNSNDGWVHTGEGAFRDDLRDPFTATAEIIKAANINNSDDSIKNTYFDSGAILKLPQLILRGIILASQASEPLALLEVAGVGVHMVRIGDEISFNVNDPKQVIKVKAISRLNILVEVGSLGDLVIVR
jgi:hypothetical protein